MPPNLKVLAYLIIAATLFFSGWTVNQWRWEAKYADQLEESRKTEQSLQETVDAITKDHIQQMRRIVSERDLALNRVRQRPDRMPESSRINCTGATGNELSGRDAEFLIRQASRADEQREALRGCYDYADKIQSINP